MYVCRIGRHTHSRMTLLGLHKEICSKCHSFHPSLLRDIMLTIPLLFQSSFSIFLLYFFSPPSLSLSLSLSFPRVEYLDDSSGEWVFMNVPDTPAPDQGLCSFNSSTGCNYDTKKGCDGVLSGPAAAIKDHEILSVTWVKPGEVRHPPHATRHPSYNTLHTPHATRHHTTHNTRHHTSYNTQHAMPRNTQHVTPLYWC